ncbi:MAG: SprB repeat-containing protein, partial [Bacteroidales bacterium]|nr:SprB repeat-containing protein [Bacteroidales bacterium]
MSKFQGLTYITSVANNHMSAGTYYVTVEGTVKGKSNHPSQNSSLPDDIQTAIFKVVPIVVGQNDIDVEKTEFTPPVCHGDKGKLKLTIAGCFLPYISQYPVFYYRTGESADKEFTYDTIHFRCTYSGTQNDPHATFECDHISAHQTYFKIVIPPLLQVAPTPVSFSNTSSLSTASTSQSSTSNAYNSKTAYFQIDFTQPDELDFPVEVKHNSGYYYVNGKLQIADDGKITVSRSEASGGTPPYSFFFHDDGANLSDKALTSDVLSTPNIGKRYITIRDSKGCSLTKTVSVGMSNETLFVKITAEREISCYNANDGILKASIEKRTSNPLRYSWYKNGTLLSGKNASMLYDLGPGTYKVVLTDTKTGMASSDEITLTQPTQLNLSVQQKTDVDCFGDMGGSLALKGSGGVAPYLYLWDGVDYGSLRRNLPAGTYQVKLIDHNSCELTKSYTISQPEKFEIIIDSVIHAHYGTDGTYVPGRILWHSQGGTKPYAALQSEAADLSRLDSGTYRLVQYDAKQCKAEQEVKLNFYDQMQIQIVQDQKILCAGEKTAACHVEIAGGYPPFDIQWNNKNAQSSIENMGSGFYFVRVKDAAGVSKTQTIFIPTPAKLVIDSLSVSHPTYHGCENDICLPNETDGRIDFAVTGGTKPYSEQWQKNGKDIEPVLPYTPNLSAGEYELHITDHNGCEANQRFYLARIEPLLAQIEITQAIDCHGNSSGILQAKASGGTPPYRYAWENRPDTLATLKNLPTGFYKVSISDSLGVEDTASLFL